MAQWHLRRKVRREEEMKKIFFLVFKAFLILNHIKRIQVEKEKLWNIMERIDGFSLYRDLHHSNQPHRIDGLELPIQLNWSVDSENEIF